MLGLKKSLRPGSHGPAFCWFWSHRIFRNANWHHIGCSSRYQSVLTVQTQPHPQPTGTGTSRYIPSHSWPPLMWAICSPLHKRDIFTGKQINKFSDFFFGRIHDCIYLVALAALHPAALHLAVPLPAALHPTTLRLLQTQPLGDSSHVSSQSGSVLLFI